MRNIDIRTEIKTNGLKLWQVAYALEITDGNFSRRLRKELNDEEKQKIRLIIKNLKKAGDTKNDWWYFTRNVDYSRGEPEI